MERAPPADSWHCLDRARARTPVWPRCRIHHEGTKDTKNSYHKQKLVGGSVKGPRRALGPFVRDLDASEARQSKVRSGFESKNRGAEGQGG